MLYRMRLQPEPFQRILKEEKVLELRLCDEKRKQIRIGDEIEFSKHPDFNETLRVEVVGLLFYKNFADLIEDLPASCLGHDESEKEYLKAGMYEIYTREEERECGVLGIRIKLIKTKK